MKKTKVGALATSIIIASLLGCGDSGKEVNGEVISTEIVTSEKVASVTDPEVSKELVYDYSKNIVDEVEDTASQNMYNVAHVFMEAVNNCDETVDFSELGLADAVIEMGVRIANEADPLCTFATCKKKDGLVYEINYDGGIERQKERKELLYSEINNILNTCVVKDNELETVCNIYDYFVRNVHYVYDIVDTSKMQIDVKAHEQNSVYGTIVDHEGVCQNYSESFAILLKQVGIENCLVIDPGQPDKFESNDAAYNGQVYAIGHEWNAVKIDNEFYHFDITFEVTENVEEWEDEYGKKHHNLDGKARDYCGLSDTSRKLTSPSENWRFIALDNIRTEYSKPVCSKDLFENKREVNIIKNENYNEQLLAKKLTDETPIELSVDTTTIKTSAGEDSLDSELIIKNNLNDKTYKVKVIMPEDVLSSAKKPVIYMLDGNLEDSSDKDLRFKDKVLVTIGYEDNGAFYDLRKDDYIDNPVPFLNILAEGIIPYVEENYPIIGEDRTFFGWSCGANFGLYALFQSDGVAAELFDHYIICSPVTKYTSDGITLEGFEVNCFRRQKSLPADVTLCTVMDAGKVLYTRQQTLATTIKKRAYTDLNLEIKEYENCSQVDVRDKAIEELLKNSSN